MRDVRTLSSSLDRDPSSAKSPQSAGILSNSSLDSVDSDCEMGDTKGLCWKTDLCGWR
jgi:hypothetical protein